MIKKTMYKLGERYTYYDKNLCYQSSIKAIKLGFQVRYGRTPLGQYYYEIVDPFQRSVE